MKLSQDGPLSIMRGRRLQFSKYIIFLPMKIDFVLANIADPDEMLHYDLGLHCLPKYPFVGFWSSKY